MLEMVHSLDNEAIGLDLMLPGTDVFEFAPFLVVLRSGSAPHPTLT
jgi:hypothetical protein